MSQADLSSNSQHILIRYNYVLMNKNTVIIILASVIGIFAFLLVAYSLTNSSSPSIYPEINAIKPSDHVTWSPDKKNILVEYNDFQCPACKNFHDFLRSFESSNSADFAITKKTTLVFRHFPLYQIHPNSMAAAYAAEAAGKQGKFFEMVNSLYSTQTDWGNLANPTDYFLKLAADLKLDTEKFKTDMNSQEVKIKVNDDLDSGNKAGINQTPTFFLNGARLDNITSFGDLRRLLIK